MAGAWTWMADLLTIFAVILGFSLAALRLRLTPAVGALLAARAGAVSESLVGLTQAQRDSTPEEIKNTDNEVVKQFITGQAHGPIQVR